MRPVLPPFLHPLQWRFTFSYFVVEPGQEYEVTVHHLPKPVPNGDPNHQSRNFLAPGKSTLLGHPRTPGCCRMTCAGGPDVSLPAQACGTQGTNQCWGRGALRVWLQPVLPAGRLILCWHKLDIGTRPWEFYVSWSPSLSLEKPLAQIASGHSCNSWDPAPSFHQPLFGFWPHILGIYPTLSSAWPRVLLPHEFICL